MTSPADPDYARDLDRQDALARYRDEFVVDDPDLIYLDGNSLGRLPKRTAEHMRQVIEQGWGERLIRGWNEGWFTAAQRIGGKVARLVGASADEVTIGDSTSVNLFKLVSAALQARPGRNKIVTDDLNFPSDIYILQGALRLAGTNYRLEIVRSADGMTVDGDALAQAIDQDTALVVLTHTAFKSGFVYEMDEVTRMAHEAGALMLWDVCHSVGAMPLEFDALGVDLAVGCTYKYLNGGPGSPAFLFVRRDLQETLVNPIWGWFGQKGQFDFQLDYQPAPGIRRWLVGTPPILSLVAIEPAVDLMLDVGVERLRDKSIRQTEYLIALWEEWLKPLGVTLNSPRDAARRGSHVSLGHPEGLRIDRALIEEMNVIPDFRYPDNIRLGIAPLYTRYIDIYEAMRRFRSVVEERRYDKFATETPEVT